MTVNLCTLVAKDLEFLS